MILRNGKLKKLLYAINIIPLYKKLQDYRFDRKYLNRQYPNRWYYKILPIRKNKIVFDSYLGKSFSDSPKAIAEEIIRQGLNYDLVWLTNTHEDMPEQIRQVKYGSALAMRELATAKIWVLNVRTVAHPRKRNKQKYLQTWHAGYVVKLIEKEAEDRLNEKYVEAAKEDGSITDAVISSSKFFSKIYQNSFWLNAKAQILEIGTPKNDVLFNDSQKKHLNYAIRKRYNIEENKRIILYFPTFRNDCQIDHYDIDFQKVINAFETRFDDKFVVLVRFHPNVPVSNTFGNQALFLENVINVTDYPEACELFSISDFMISDYSGVMLAFSLQKKPFFVYASDYDDYAKERGFNELFYRLPCRICKNSDELVTEIVNFDSIEYKKKLEKLLQYINPYEDGKASERAVEWIKKQIRK